ncbi:MAG: hypothetical protein C0406_01840 [Sideroxydans sp.]|nr:hypothetical protein [Sideroxydans sp.]
MKRTNASQHPKFAALLASAALLGLVSQSALAAGTASGTSISNTATLAYSVGAVTQTPITSAAAAFVVDNKVNLIVAELGGAATTVIPDPTLGTVSTSTFTVTNTGNTTQDFSLAVADLANGTANPFGGALTDNYNSTPACTVTNIVVAAGSMGAYTAGDSHINALTADSSATVTVSCTTPAAQANNSLAVISLTATAFADDAANTLGGVLANDTGVDVPGTVQIVFADVAGSDDAALSGSHSARDAFVVQTAVLSVSKVATVICDPANGGKDIANPKNIPGAYVQYAITISNTGTAAATLSTVTDALQAQLTFDTALISGAGAATNCAAGLQSLSATGFGALRGTGATTYAAPGLATQDVTAGATTSGQNVTINFATLAGTAYGAADAVLPANGFVTVYFNAFVQ